MTKSWLSGAMNDMIAAVPAVTVEPEILSSATKASTAAMIDRLVHRAAALTLAGGSHRTRARRELLTKDHESRPEEPGLQPSVPAQTIGRL